MDNRTILTKLREIEKDHKIKILYSCESGSRAWGFASTDSDYDVRFIYLRQAEEYLSILPKKDHLSFPINDELDIYGWDISKILRLIVKSNTTPFEWLQSPIEYRENFIFKKELWELCQNYFCFRSNIHHYLGIAKGAMDTMHDKTVKIKRLFYVLRPMLAALWCANHNSIAPMSIYPLMDLLTNDMRAKFLSLIEQKATANEGYLIRVETDIRNWIEQTATYCKEASDKEVRKTFEVEEVDQFFRKMILSK